MKWYRKAAEQGLAEAQHDLGVMYDKGRVVPQDYTEAVKWYLKAAEQGHDFAQRRLGRMYHIGLGLPKDYVEAHKWSNIAAAAGDAHAGKHRDLIAKLMTPEQIAEAQKMAREWEP
jgi:TPR repeat protein